jgi:hypothetical protein
MENPILIGEKNMNIDMSELNIKGAFDSMMRQMDAINGKAFDGKQLSKLEFIAHAAALANDFFDSAYNEENRTYGDQIACFGNFIKENCC